MKQHLLLIDTQIDFCDLPSTWCPTDPISGLVQSPALPVPGAHTDMLRLAQWIDAHQGEIEQITLTLDSHHRYDIAHPSYWVDAAGLPPSPFTVISAEQVATGVWRPVDPQRTEAALAYVKQLEAEGRYQLMIWPEHCIEGSWGHGIHPAVLAAVGRWETAHRRPAPRVIKGTHAHSEHYSVFRAEVPDPSAPDTALNTELIATLDQADQILVAGEASSHCVRASVEHLVSYLPSGQASKVVLITDCMSPVSGFEAAAAGFVRDQATRGVRLMQAADSLGSPRAS